jgi:hypothetical protein
LQGGDVGELAADLAILLTIPLKRAYLLHFSLNLAQKNIAAQKRLQLS